MGTNNSGRDYIADNDSSLLQYLYRTLSGQSRSSIKAYLTHGQVTVNGQNTTAFDYPVHKGDRISILDKGMMIKKRGGDKETRVKIVFEHNLQENWNESVLERKYCAIIEGRPREAEGTVRSWLKENPKSLKVTSSPVDNGGKEAVTHYRVISSGKHYSLTEFELETGRKHQIRVHASLMGCPVAGDRRYGAKENPMGRIALHARSIVFRHPVTGKIMSFDTGLPSSFKAVMKEDTFSTDQNR